MIAEAGPAAIGVDIGGTKVAAGLVDQRGRLLTRLVRPTPSHSPVAVEDAIVAAVRDLESRATGPVPAIGIGAAGWVDTDQAMVRFSPHLAWRDEPLRERLAHRLALPLLVDNDANAAAWAEYRFGAGRGSSVMVCLTLGTGIGGALVVRGNLFRGRYGMAGEFGHMTVVPDGHWCPCGNRGCWEQYSSGNALEREARALAGTRSPRAAAMLAQVDGDPTALAGHHVSAAAQAGDPAALDLITEVGQWLGRGIANLVAGLDPDLIVIGGGLSDLDDLLLEPAREVFARQLTGRGHRPLARIERALLGPDAGLIGAADLARQSIEDPPGLSGFWPRRRWRSRRLLAVPGESEGRLTAGRRRNPRGRGVGGAG